MSKELGDFARTLSHLQTLLTFNPNDGQVMAYLGETLNNLKRWREAARWYKKAIKLSPSVECGGWSGVWHHYLLQVKCSAPSLVRRHLDEFTAPKSCPYPVQVRIPPSRPDRRPDTRYILQKSLKADARTPTFFDGFVERSNRNE